MALRAVLAVGALELGLKHDMGFQWVSWGLTRGVLCMGSKPKVLDMVPRHIRTQPTNVLSVRPRCQLWLEPMQGGTKNSSARVLQPVQACICRRWLG